MLYFKTIGFYSPNREKGEAFTNVSKLEWKQHEDSDREFAVLQVQQFTLVGNKLLPLKSAPSAHYVWRFTGNSVSYPKGELWTEEPYVADDSATTIEAVASEESPA